MSCVDATGVFQESYEYVTDMLQIYYEYVTNMLQIHYEYFTNMLVLLTSLSSSLASNPANGLGVGSVASGVALSGCSDVPISLIAPVKVS
jgi:hypothetical protein